MRELTSHKVPGLNEALRIVAVDEQGPGGANHHYEIHYERRNAGPASSYNDDMVIVPIHFQEGPIQEAGVNGLSNEALLALVEDRLQGFQAGEFACRENAIALTKVQEAMMWLQKRTRDRIARGVEGTSQK